MPKKDKLFLDFTKAHLLILQLFISFIMNSYFNLMIFIKKKCLGIHCIEDASFYLVYPFKSHAELKTDEQCLENIFF